MTLGYSTRSWSKNALLPPDSRAAYHRLLDQGWAEALLAMHTEKSPCTFWQHLSERVAAGGRLAPDYLLVSPALAPKLHAAGVDKWSRGEPDASDHAPTWIVFD